MLSSAPTILVATRHRQERCHLERRFPEETWRIDGELLLGFEWHPPSLLHLELAVLAQPDRRRYAAANDLGIAQPALHGVGQALEVSLRDHPAAKRSSVSQQRVDFASHSALERDPGSNGYGGGDGYDIHNHSEHSAHPCLTQPQAAASCGVTTARPFSRPARRRSYAC